MSKRWESLPERAGMLTPLAPWTSVTTPWARTLVAAKAKRRIDEVYCILKVVGWLVGWL